MLGNGICRYEKGQLSLLRNTKLYGNKLDLVNGKSIPFGDRGVSELAASVLVPRGICPDLFGERCWDQK